MATPVIKLQPIRMGSLISSEPTVAGQKYVPPNMRTDTGPIKVDLGVNNFPCLGAAPRKSLWGKSLPVTAAPVSTAAVVTEAPVATATLAEPKHTLKNMIEEQIRQAQLEEEERQKPKEEDPLKMTREELLADGWVILPLSSAHEARLRLNTIVSPAYVDSSEI